MQPTAPPERFAPDDPREWLNRARSNLRRASHRTPGIYLEDLCFDAQQAAEKAIKAILIGRAIDFPYVHDLAELARLLEADGLEIPDQVLRATKLTPYAAWPRRPELVKPVTVAEYEEAVALAETVLHWAEGVRARRLDSPATSATEAQVKGPPPGPKERNPPSADQRGETPRPAPLERQASPSADPPADTHRAASPDPSVLDVIVRRVVEVAKPERIILFGSGARDEMGPHSDIDLLVVAETDDAHRLTADIYGNLFGVGAPVDVVVASPEQVERYRDTHALIIKPALREGVVVYDAAR